MAKIKIISNPYDKTIEYLSYKPISGNYEPISQDSINSKLRENDPEKIFFPFMVKDIVDTIVHEYDVGKEIVEIEFEGTSDEYEEIENICKDETIKDRVTLTQSKHMLENARDILEHTKEAFDRVNPIIKSIITDNDEVLKDLEKLSDALEDIIPICIFGNYSAGKSTFINALIGYELLPSGGDSVTAKIFEIRRSAHQDRAHVSFEYLNEEYELVYDNKGCRVILGNKDADIIKEILSTVNDIDGEAIFWMVNRTVNILNQFEKRDKSSMVIGNIVKISAPFCENGKLGQSRNEFVIFDTPGSNSQTNIDHEKVLTESLDGFSNGIPVWMTLANGLDSTDNAQLCDKLYKIAALDKRFTMIIVNQADSAQLPKEKLDEEDIQTIMEYDSIVKMYSSGIYFASAIMGLGAKNPDGIRSDYLFEIFEEKERKFSDPEARSYKRLYNYNIMPEQMKNRAVKASEEFDNLVYANSGVYCIELAMDNSLADMRHTTNAIWFICS